MPSADLNEPGPPGKTPPAPVVNHVLAAVQNLGLIGLIGYAWLVVHAIGAEVAIPALLAIAGGIAVPAIKSTGPNAAAAGAAGVLSSVIEGAVRSLRPPTAPPSQVIEFKNVPKDPPAP